MARHIRKLNDPQKVHSDHAFPINAKCAGCGIRPLIRAITLAPLDEARKRMPSLDSMLMTDPELVMQHIVQINESAGSISGVANPKPYFRLGVAYACKTCAPSMERQLAKGPSWVIVEINRGPTERMVFGETYGS